MFKIFKYKNPDALKYLHILFLFLTILTLSLESFWGETWRVLFVVSLIVFVPLLTFSKILQLLKNPAVIISFFAFLISFFHWTFNQTFQFPIFELQAALLAFCVFSFMENNTQNDLYKIFVFAFLVILPITWIVAILTSNINWSGFRIELLSSPNIVGLLSIFSLFIAISILTTQQYKQPYKVLITISAIISYITLILTNSRGAFIGAFLLLAIILFTISSMSFGKKIAILVMYIVFPTILFGPIRTYTGLFLFHRLTPVDYLQLSGNTMKLLMVPATDNVIPDGALNTKLYNGRDTIWKVTYSLIKEKPIWGYGKRVFKDFYPIEANKYYAEKDGLPTAVDTTPIESSIRNPHNLLLGLLFDYGIIYTLIYFTFYLYTLFILYKKIKQSPNTKALICFSILFAYLCYGAYEYQIFRPIPEFIFCILAYIYWDNKIINISKIKI